MDDMLKENEKIKIKIICQLIDVISTEWAISFSYIAKLHNDVLFVILFSITAFFFILFGTRKLDHR